MSGEPCTSVASFSRREVCPLWRAHVIYRDDLGSMHKIYIHAETADDAEDEVIRLAKCGFREVLYCVCYPMRMLRVG